MRSPRRADQGRTCELNELRRQNRVLKAERDLLSQATALFAQRERQPAPAVMTRSSRRSSPSHRSRSCLTASPRGLAGG
jgi:transposase-like protein